MVFSPLQPPAEYCRLLQLANEILDPPHRKGNNADSPKLVADSTGSRTRRFARP